MSDLGGKSFLVTGANTGIGRATAHDLAQRGGRVVLACRSEAKTVPVIEDIVKTTGNADVGFLQLDLADLDSVRGAARTFLERDEPLHVLINNAGVAGQRGKTAQGFELAFGINHLGHFLLTTLLLDRLLASGPARVVNVSSDSHYQAKGIDYEAVCKPTKGVTGLPEYAVSKLCNVLFAQELARRVPAAQLSATALHPGVIASDIWRRIPGPARWLVTRFMKSTEEGAATSLYCATSPDLVGQSGGFYVDAKPKAPNKIATPELGRELWERSEAFVLADANRRQ
jgi:NAD(P)-dependent dehydrogenase (short-subunit alcohol dehydrogenase family)